MLTCLTFMSFSEVFLQQAEGHQICTTCTVWRYTKIRQIQDKITTENDQAIFVIYNGKADQWVVI